MQAGADPKIAAFTIEGNREQLSRAATRWHTRGAGRAGLAGLETRPGAPGSGWEGLVGSRTGGRRAMGGRPGGVDECLLGAGVRRR